MISRHNPSGALDKIERELIPEVELSSSRVWCRHNCQMREAALQSRTGRNSPHGPSGGINNKSLQREFLWVPGTLASQCSCSSGTWTRPSSARSCRLAAPRRMCTRASWGRRCCQTWWTAPARGTQSRCSHPPGELSPQWWSMGWVTVQLTFSLMFAFLLHFWPWALWIFFPAPAETRPTWLSSPL